MSSIDYVLPLQDVKNTNLTLLNAMDDGVKDMLEYHDDGYIELVLKLLARICDGQHSGLQVWR